MATAIHRCKACNKVERVEYRRELHSIGYGRKDAVYFRESDGARALSPLPVVCCGRPMGWNWLKAYTNAAVKCNARCTHAVGFNCECSCGGENHARGGMFTGLLAA
jgi:hypothetical protein